MIAAKAYGFEGGNSLRENEEVRFQPGMKLVSSIPTPLGSASSSVAYEDLKLRTEAVLHLTACAALRTTSQQILAEFSRNHKDRLSGLSLNLMFPMH